MTESNLKISVITVCYNAERCIENAIKSVLSQTYNNIEYIIVDGASTDGTLGIISKYKEKIGKIISEKDGGIYDAMNKGVRLATGDIIYFLNSDDRFYDGGVISNVVCEFIQNPNVELIYGKIFPVNIPQDLADRFEKIFTRNFGFKIKRDLLKRGMTQQNIFVKKFIFDKTGPLNKDFKTSSDFDWMLRVFNKGIQVHYIDRYFVYFNYQGMSYQQRDKTILERIFIVYKNCSLPELLYYMRCRIQDAMVNCLWNFKKNI